MPPTLARLKASLIRQLGGGAFVRNVTTVMSGTVLAQVVALSASLLLARIFTPEAYGGAAIFTSITGIVAVVAGLRYDVAVMLPTDDDEARVLYRLASRCILVVCVATTAIAALALPVLAPRMDDPHVARWLLLTGVSAYFVAQISALQYWLNRRTRYRAIASSRVDQSLGTAGGQVGMGLVGLRSMGGLVLGQIAGQVWAWARIVTRTRDVRAPLAAGAPSMRDMARRYRKMPLFNGPSVLIDALRLNGINLIVGTYAVSALGQFNMSWRLLQVPAIVINGAISQVFFQRLSTAVPGQMTRLVRASVLRLVLIGVVPFALIWVLSPWLFPFALGEQWRPAGYFARALVPWLFMELITAPISTVFLVAERQQRMLVFSAIFCAAPLTLLSLAPWDLHTTIYVLGGLMAVMLVAIIVLADITARQFDAGFVAPERDDR